MWRWFSINIDEALALRRYPPRHRQGDLHRGWVFDDGRAASIAEWQAADRAGRRRADPAGGRTSSRATSRTGVRADGGVLRVADIGQAGGTLVNEGLTRWTYRDDDGAARTGLRHRRVPPPARRRREACRPGRVGADRDRVQPVGTAPDVADELAAPSAAGWDPAAALGWRVADHQRLRPRDDRGRCGALILQQERGDGPPRPAGCGSRRPCSRRPAGRASRCPGGGRRRGGRARPRLAGGRTARGGDHPPTDPAGARVCRRQRAH